MNIDGKYDVKLVVMGQFQDGSIVINTQPDGSLSGTLATMGNTADYTDGTWDGKNFFMKVAVKGATLKVNGTIDEEGNIEGKAKRGVLTVALKGKKVS